MMVTSLSLIASLGLVIYILLIGLVHIGLFKKNEVKKVASNSTKLKFSIIIPCRNEAKRCKNLLESLSGINYPKDYYEVIFINDHSTDQTLSILQQYSSTQPNLKVLSLPENLQGKKQALSWGIENSNFDYIVTTDADCWLPPNILKSYYKKFSTASIDLCIGVVSMRNGKSWLEKFQYYDYIAMQAFNYGISSYFYPILCSGANLAYTKEGFLKSEAYQKNLNILSGDDTFLLEAMLQQKMNYSLVYTTENLVYTEPSTNLHEFIEQRKRWLTKLPKSNNKLAKYIGWILLIGNASWLILLGISLFNFGFFNLFIILSILKFGIEFFVTLTMMKRVNLLGCNRVQLLQQFIYPFLLVLFSFMLTIKRKTHWKEREIS